MLNRLLMVIAVVTGCAISHAQQFGLPVDRQFFPVGDFGAFLFWSEASAESDRESALLRGEVDSIETRQYDRLTEDGKFDDSGYMFLLTRFDACGNNTHVSMSAVDGGESFGDRAMSVETVYAIDGCDRSSATVDLGGAKQQVAYAYSLNGGLESVSTPHGELRLVRGDERHVLKQSVAEFGDETIWEYANKTGRLVAIRDGSSTHIARWDGDRSLKLTRTLDGEEWQMRMSLDDNDNITEIRLDENRMFGRVHKYDYELDARGNWIERVLRIAKEPGGEFLLVRKWVRKIEYRE